MASLLSKVKVLISASLHSLLDDALRQNSLQVFDEYIRQAERSIDAFQDTMVELAASVKMLKRKYDEAATDAARLDLTVDNLLKADKETLAKVTMNKLNHQTEIARVYKQQLDRQGQTYQTLYDVIAVLNSKVDTLKMQREQVAVLLQLVRTKNIASRSIKDVQAIADNNTKALVENVQSQLDTADARLEVATSRLSDQIDQEVDNAELNTQLDARRAKLGLT